MWNMRRAEKHAEKLRPVLRVDARFQHIRLGAFTGAGGSLSVSGEVESEEDRKELKRIIMESNPPTEVVFLILSREQLRKLKKSGVVNPNDAPALN